MKEREWVQQRQTDFLRPSGVSRCTSVLQYTHKKVARFLMSVWAGQTVMGVEADTENWRIANKIYEGQRSGGTLGWGRDVRKSRENAHNRDTRKNCRGCFCTHSAWSSTSSSTSMASWSHSEQTVFKALHRKAESSRNSSKSSGTAWLLLKNFLHDHL